jgi:cell division protein FtsL
MMEFVTVKRIDNSRLVRMASPRQWREFWRMTGLGAALAALLLVYAAQHFRCLRVQYQLEELNARRAESAELNGQLKLQAAVLRAPGRIDELARGRLGLTAPVPGQVAPAVQTAEGILAQARAVRGWSTPQPAAP